MIVIATHGESGWKKFLFGSVSEKVIRLAECPVLAIPEPV
jgi:nucleotide-binding universal stress UspA family protein